MKRIEFLILFFVTLSAKAQVTDDYQQVDEFKTNKVPVKVFFKDPLKIILKVYPDFDTLPGKEKNEMLDAYLHNNILYVFQTFPKNAVSKCYVLKGNENKVRTARFYDLQIVSCNLTALNGPYDNSVEKTINKVSVGGDFFEHMMLFQNPEGKKALGKLINIWGYFSMIQPYDNVKAAITGIIKQDMDNAIPEDIIARPELMISPLFDYETCALKHVKSKTSLVTVYQYDESGKIIHEYPRTEKDNDLYHASTSADDIGGPTAFPFFSAADTIKEIAKSVFTVNSTQKYLNHYLKNIKVFKNEQTGNVERIEGTLLIHAYSASGESVSYELYMAEFGKFGECYLPKTIKFCSPDDTAYKQPRIITSLSYELKE